MSKALEVLFLAARLAVGLWLVVLSYMLGGFMIYTIPIWTLFLVHSVGDFMWNWNPPTARVEDEE